MKIKLQSGKEVYFEAFHCTPTYAGLLAGVPTKESNETLIKHLSCPSNWGNRKCIMKKSDMYASENILKPIINSVWLSSSEPVDANDKLSDGSELVLMFFSEEQLDKSIQEIIIAGVGDIKWEKFARDFEF
jgi:hypothetical protein